jgi:hypothetical protein
MNRPPLKLIALLTLGAAAFLQTAAAREVDTRAVAKELDALLAQDWAKEKITPNPPVSDEVFVRRIYLDAVGRIPTFRETEEFLTSTSENKRAELIDKLLASDGYALHLFNYWADVLRVQSAGAIGTTTGAAYIQFIKESLQTNKPYDQFVRELISAKGRPWQNGAIGYYMRDQRMPLDNFANTARIFLGTRIECAQCHNHPFDKWTQMQFYQMTAFTYGNDVKAYENPAMMGSRELLKTERKDLTAKMKEAQKAAAEAGEKPKSDYRWIVDNFGFIGQAVADIQYLAMGGTGVVYDDTRKLELPHDYQYPDAQPKAKVEAKTMFGPTPERAPGESNPEAYARWMTSPENPRFTAVIANRLWKLAFGMGVIEPLDDMSDINTPVNPALMKRLEALVRESGYDMKATLRVIFNTCAYQAAATKQEVTAGTTYHFPGPILRRMTAEQMWDSFITLINAAPYATSRTIIENQHNRIVKSAKLVDALDLITPEEALQGAKVAAESYRAAAEMANNARPKIEAAKAAGDTKTAEEITKRVAQVQGGGRRALGRVIYVPAVQRLAALKAGKPAPPSPFSDKPVHITEEDLLADTVADPTMPAQQIPVKGYDLSEKTPEQQQAEAAQEEQAILDAAEYFKIPETKRKGFVAMCRNQRIYWTRAADTISPAFRGSYLRIFGQSDRELIENSSRDASVPQALTLMNSDLLKTVMSSDTQLMLAIKRSPDSEAQMEATYLTLLSRKPTDQERAVWQKAQAAGLDSIEDLIYALINTRRFIFIE